MPGLARPLSPQVSARAPPAPAARPSFPADGTGPEWWVRGPPRGTRRGGPARLSLCASPPGLRRGAAVLHALCVHVDWRLRGGSGQWSPRRGAGRADALGLESAACWASPPEGHVGPGEGAVLGLRAALCPSTEERSGTPLLLRAHPLAHGWRASAPGCSCAWRCLSPSAKPGAPVRFTAGRQGSVRAFRELHFLGNPVGLTTGRALHFGGLLLTSQPEAQASPCWRCRPGRSSSRLVQR